MLNTLAVANYRSLRDLVIKLGPLNVVTGPNGSGKSNLYRALRLLAQTAQGGVTASLTREGGLDSALWAGPESFSRGMRKGEVPVQGGLRKDPVNLRLGFVGEEFGYAIDLGLPPPRATSAFGHDPEIKRECIWAAPVFRPAALLVDRRGPLVRVRTDAGQWEEVSHKLASFDTMFTQLADPQRTPEVLTLRDQIRSWRFYDHFRTDAAAPARQVQVGTYTPVLDDEGRDLAAALQTITEIGDSAALREAIDDAFPGSTLSVRPPELMVFNEPETSLHPDLLPALARLLAKTAPRSQIWVVSHSPGLVASLQKQRGCNPIVLEKELGQTMVERERSTFRHGPGLRVSGGHRRSWVYVPVHFIYPRSAPARECRPRLVGPRAS
jgi:predicted ATPase